MSSKSRAENRSDALAPNLFVVGGAADTTVADFARLAGGAAAHVVIVPHASGDPQGAADDFAAGLKTAGVVNITISLPGAPLVIPAGTTAVFMTGGDQNRLVTALSRADQAALLAFCQGGGLVGGTSAGAMALSDIMIGGGLNDDDPDLMVRVGLGLLVRIIIDTHFAQRGRFLRPMGAIAVSPRALGAIGLDEDTAVFIQGSRVQVFGKGKAWVYRAYRRGANLRVNRQSYAAGKKFRLPGW
jgi:cyanophycinase